MSGKRNKAPKPHVPEPIPMPEGERELFDLLQAATSHLDYCGWGDSWERECITDDRSYPGGKNLEEAIRDAIGRRMK